MAGAAAAEDGDLGIVSLGRSEVETVSSTSDPPKNPQPREATESTTRSNAATTDVASNIGPASRESTPLHRIDSESKSRSICVTNPQPAEDGSKAQSLESKTNDAPSSVPQGRGARVQASSLQTVPDGRDDHTVNLRPSVAVAQAFQQRVLARQHVGTTTAKAAEYPVLTPALLQRAPATSGKSSAAAIRALTGNLLDSDSGDETEGGDGLLSIGDLQSLLMGETAGVKKKLGNRKNKPKRSTLSSKAKLRRKPKLSGRAKQR